MQNQKFWIRLSIVVAVLLMLAGSVFAQDTFCLATPDGPDPVKMLADPDSSSEVVNLLTARPSHPVDDAVKGEIPSELEPEGYVGLWFHLTPEDGSPDGWVYNSLVDLYGNDCEQYIP